MKNGGKYWRIFLAGVALLAAGNAYSQSADSIRQRADSLYQLNVSKYDSTSNKVNNKVDSFQGKMNGIVNPDIYSLGHNAGKKISERIGRKRTQVDTLRAKKQLDSSRLVVNQKIDSLKVLNLSTEHWTRKRDSLNQMNPGQYLQQMEARAEGGVQKVEDKINAPVREVQGKLDEKLALMNKEGGARANIPGSSNLPGVEVEADLNTKVAEGVNVPATGLEINNPLGKIDNPLQEQMGSVTEAKDKISDRKNVPQEHINKIKSFDEVQSAEQKLGLANELTDKAQAYSGDVKNIAQGNLGEVKEIPKGIEQQASNMREVQELQMQTGEVEKYREMLGKGNDPEALQSLVKEQGKQHVIVYAKNHFAGKEAVLQQAMDKMTKLKSKYASLDSLTNLPRYKPNAMKGKPFVERLVPSLNFQIQKAANVWLDYGTLLGYRVSGRLIMGLGWNERIGIGKKFRFTLADRIYGPRVFGDVMIWKGFAARVELEKMKTKVQPELVDYADASGKAWIWSTFVGLRKQYDFSRRVKGNFQMLYNIFDDHDSSPYLDRINVRFGFDFPLRKRNAKMNPEK